MNKLIIVPWVICVVVMYLRGIQLKYYCKRKGYKTETKSKIESLLSEVRIILVGAIPLLNLFLIYTFLTKDDDEILKPAFEKGTIYEVDEQGVKIPYRRFSFKI